MGDLHGRNLDVKECPRQTRPIVCQLYALFALANDPSRKVSLVRGGTELVRCVLPMWLLVLRDEKGASKRGTHDVAVERPVLCRYNLEEILEHVIGRFSLSRTKINISRGVTRSIKLRWNVGANMRVDFIKGAPVYAQDPLDIRVKGKTCISALCLGREGKFMNKVTKIVVHILEVRHNLEHFGTVEHEGPSGGELDVPCNFVHAHRAEDVAPLVGPLLQMILPLFLYALIYGGSAVSEGTE